MDVSITLKNMSPQMWQSFSDLIKLHLGAYPSNIVEFDIEEAIRQLATESILKDASTPVDCPALEILLNGLKDILIVVMYQSFSDTKKISLNAIAKEGGN